MYVRRWITFVFFVAALGTGFGFVGVVIAIGHASWLHLPHGVEAKDYFTIGRREAGTGTFSRMTVADYENIQGAVAGQWAFAHPYPQRLSARDAEGAFRQVAVRDVSANFFQILGVRPAFGELFAPQGGVVISYRLWERWYEGAESAIGLIFNLEKELSRTIVGVAPPRFADVFVGQADAWLLNSGMEYADDWRAQLGPTGKLIFGTFDEPDGLARLEALAADYRFVRSVEVGWRLTGFTKVADQDRLDATPGIEVFPARRGEARQRLGWLAVAIVVMLSLIFLALLDSLTAGQESRLKEAAVRVAVGASPKHLFLEALVANLLWLVPIAAIAWLTFSYFNAVLLAIEPFATHPRDIPPVSQVFGLAASALLLVAVFCGSIAWMSYAISKSSREASWLRPHELTAHRQTQRGLLCIAAVSLLVAASLAERYVIDSRYSAGFDLNSAVLFPLKRYGEMLTEAESEALSLALRATPGMKSATRAELAPLVSRSALATTRVRVNAPETLHRNLRDVHVYRNAIGAHYFETLDIDLIVGRPIEGPAEVVLSQTLAALLTEEPIDALGLPVVVEAELDRPEFDGPKLDGKKGVYTVVGVAPDVSYYEYDEAPLPIIYQDGSHHHIYDQHVVRFNGKANDLEALVKQSSPFLEFVDVKLLKEEFDQQFAERRSVELVLAVSAAFALVLALAAIAMSLSRTIADARASIGILFTVGATAADVTKLQMKSVAIDLAMAATVICAIYATVHTTGFRTAMLQLWLAPPALVLLLVFCAFTIHAAVGTIARRPLAAVESSPMSE